MSSDAWDLALGKQSGHELSPAQVNREAVLQGFFSFCCCFDFASVLFFFNGLMAQPHCCL